MKTKPITPTLQEKLEGFNYNLEDSFKLYGQIVKNVTKLEAVGLPKIQAEWTMSKKHLADLLDPVTGRVVFPITEDASDGPTAQEYADAQFYAMDYYRKKLLHPALDAAAYNVHDVPSNGGKTQYSLGREVLQELFWNLTSIEVVQNKIGKWSDPRKGKEAKFLEGVKLGKFARLLAESRGIAHPYVLDTVVTAMGVATERLMKKKEYMVISANPLDFAMVSEHTNSGWTSCHSLHGIYCTGAMAYLLDSTSVVCYSYKDVKSYKWLDDKKTLLPTKTWRQMAFLDLRGFSAIMSREYPCTNSSQASAAQRGVAHVLHKALAKADPRDMRITFAEGDFVANFAEKPAAYNVFNLNGCMSSYYRKYDHGGWRYAGDDSRSLVQLQTTHMPTAHVGVEEIVCPTCGDGRTDSMSTKRLLCSKCTAVAKMMEGSVLCRKCGKFPYPEHQVMRGGVMYCDDCYQQNVVSCSHCGADSDEDDYALTQVGRHHYCNDCLYDIFTRCEHCNEWVRDVDVYSDARGDACCEPCYSDRCTNCDDCGEVMNRDDLVEYRSGRHDRYVCQYCYDRWEEENAEDEDESEEAV